MKKEILAIDDSKAIRFLLQTVLGKEYQMITVPDGCSAMHRLSKKGLPDLIIADPQLPDMENWELIEQLASSGIYSSIPIIVLSGINKAETELKCMEYRIPAHFLKPFNPVELVATVKELIENKVTSDYPAKAI
jgi:CheY-like chemotaxis protein